MCVRTNLFETEYRPLANSCEQLKGNVVTVTYKKCFDFMISPLNAELNPIRHLLTLVGAHHILHVSRVRVSKTVSTRTLLVKVVTSFFGMIPVNKPFKPKYSTHFLFLHIPLIRKENCNYNHWINIRYIL